MTTTSQPISVGPWIIRGEWRLCSHCEARVALTTVAGDERTVMATCPQCGYVETHWADERMETHACACGAAFVTKTSYGMAGSPHWRDMKPTAPVRETSCEACRLEQRASRYRQSAARLAAKAAKLRTRQANPTT
jgi:protein-arginine kinase activator protein McsA